MGCVQLSFLFVQQLTGIQLTVCRVIGLRVSVSVCLLVTFVSPAEWLNGLRCCLGG